MPLREVSEAVQEILYILLPIAAASGWLGARRHYSAKIAASELENLRQACRGSLDLLLRDSPDKAAELMSGALDVSGDSYSSHMALAALARKEGLVERAIALHQALLSISGQSEDERGKILFELGMDYLRAGLFDRAEDVYSGLLSLPSQREAAAVQLLDIYQQEKDWPKAMDCLKAMGGKGKRGESVAQFYCEMAQVARAGGHARDASACLSSALEHEPACVRASLLAAELAVDAEEFAQAYRCLKKVEEQNTLYVTEILPWFLSYGERLAERRELMEYLDRLGAKYNSPEAAVTMATLISREEGLDKAVDYLSATVAARPSLKGLHALLVLLCELPAPASHLFVLRQSLQRYVVNSSNYHCSHCGFGAETLYWRCPACLHWETMRMRHDVVGA